MLKQFLDILAGCLRYALARGPQQNVKVAILYNQNSFETTSQRLLSLCTTTTNDIISISDFISKAAIAPPESSHELEQAEVRFIIRDLATGSKPELGYSIKSKLGAHSALINSNKDESNFIYRLEGITDAQMDYVNTLPRFKAKFEYLKEIGATWSFVDVAGEALRGNLTLLDLGMARIVAECMLKYYTGVCSAVSDTCIEVTSDDPLHICGGGVQPMYEYKIKQFLLAFALGMTVSTPWNGAFNANGGYIIVKEDGDIVCYHFFDRNDLEDYLFYNTAFDTPSTSRHGFGNVYKKDGEYFIKLNLLIRFPSNSRGLPLSPLFLQ
jgi:hypothetical protein